MWVLRYIRYLCWSSYYSTVINGTDFHFNRVTSKRRICTKEYLLKDQKLHTGVVGWVWWYFSSHICLPSFYGMSTQCNGIREHHHSLQIKPIIPTTKHSYQDCQGILSPLSGSPQHPMSCGNGEFFWLCLFSLMYSAKFSGVELMCWCLTKNDG